MLVDFAIHQLQEIRIPLVYRQLCGGKLNCWERAQLASINSLFKLINQTKGMPHSIRRAMRKVKSPKGSHD